jgi:hypothetical protein
MTHLSRHCVDDIMEIDPRRIEVLDAMVAEILRRKSGTERVQMTVESNRSMRRRLEAQIRQLHPNWTDDEVRAEIARRVLNGAG